jgi:hypothetical protein
MGLEPNPFMAVRFYYYWAEEFVKGNRRERDNPLRWDHVKLNLSGHPEYDPTFPRVMKWDEIIRNIAGDLAAFVDDLRASAHSVEQAWAIARQVVSRLQYFGLQDAPQKRIPPVRNPGALAGSVFTTTGTDVLQSVSQVKWDRANAQLDELQSMIGSSSDGLVDYKRLEEIRDFPGHISMTYSMVTPYLKGLHLTLASHHLGCNEFGWNVASKEWAAYLHEAVESRKSSGDEAIHMMDATLEPSNPEWDQDQEKVPPPPRERKPPPPPPKQTGPVARLARYVKAMASLFVRETPGQVLLRASQVYTIIYGFANASGSGFGSTVMLKGEIRYRIGTWGPYEDETSNYREFENVVAALREEEEAGNLENALMLLCTGNSTVESAIVKGNSSSEKQGIN